MCSIIIGMASIIVNYFRTLATNSTSDNSLEHHANVSSKLCHRLPQYLLQLLSKRGNRIFEDESDVPKLTYGETKILESYTEYSQITDPALASLTDQLHHLEQLNDSNQCGPFIGSMVYVII